MPGCSAALRSRAGASGQHRRRDVIEAPADPGGLGRSQARDRTCGRGAAHHRGQRLCHPSPQNCKVIVGEDAASAPAGCEHCALGEQPAADRDLGADLKILYRRLVPTIILLSCIGAYSAGIFWPRRRGPRGVQHRRHRINCKLAPLLMVSIIGPMLEENFRGAMLIGKDDPEVFVGHLPSATLLALVGSADPLPCPAGDPDAAQRGAGRVGETPSSSTTNSACIGGEAL